MLISVVESGRVVMDILHGITYARGIAIKVIDNFSNYSAIQYNPASA